jgi:nucleoside-diphosphate-sugar epimerase
MGEQVPADEAPDVTAPRPSIVVLGGTGFVGRAVCETLAAAGYAVTAAGRKPVEPPRGCTMLCLDVVRAFPGELAAVLTKLNPVAVVNAAGTLWAVDDLQPTDEEMSAGNLALVDRLIEALARLDFRPRLIHLGSTYEYGPQPANALLTEETGERPVTRYSRTKLAATRLVREAVENGRIDAVTLRLTITLGPQPPSASLFGRVALGLAAHPERLEIPALEDERDFVDARDVGDAVLAAVRAPAAPPLLNIASSTIVPVADAVDLLIKISQESPTIVWQPRETARKDALTIGAQRIDISAAREQLGWEPRRTPLGAQCRGGVRRPWRSLRGFPRTFPVTTCLAGVIH